MKQLLHLYSIESVHPNEQEISDYIISQLKELGADYSVNEYGITGCSKEYKQGVPCMDILLSAHMDQVKTNGAAKHFYLKDGCIRGYLDNNQQTSLGADDKNGVWLILKALKDKLPIQFIISRGEEVGCVGINRLKIPEADMCLVLGRGGYHEILKSGGGTNYCSTLAQCLCSLLGGKWETGSGSVSDTQVICKQMESVNISTAYYKPHSAEEYTNWDELQNLRSVIKDIVENFYHYPTDPGVYNKSIYGGFYDKQSSLFGRGYY